MVLDPFFVLAQYADLSKRTCVFLGNHGGFSGARLWRVAGAAHDWCLRAWPEKEMDAQRLTEIHQLMRQASDAGLAFVPGVLQTLRKKSWVEYAGRLWEIVSWMPGAADFWQHPSSARIEAACTALAQLHLAWQPAQPIARPWPALARRVERFQTWQPQRTTGWRLPIHAFDPVTPLARQAWNVLRKQLSLGWEETVENLEVMASNGVAVQPCLSDIWHDHVLFRGEQVTGLIDYGSVKVDHVSVDLARLLGSLAENDETLWQAGLSGYQEFRPLSDDDIIKVRLLDRTGVIAGVMNWLTWLYEENRSLENRQAVADRLGRLVKRVEEWSEQDPRRSQTCPAACTEE